MKVSMLLQTECSCNNYVYYLHEML